MSGLAIVGGGAAGLMAAAAASELGVPVTLYEKNDKVGRKLGITGKGRCNLTNDCTLEEFLSSVPSNPRFLYSAFTAFPPAEVMRFFEEHGVPLKVERGKRVFPVSDRAADIVNALRKITGYRVIHEKVTDLTAEDGRIKYVVTSKGREEYDAVIVCTGGISYPQTGSDGDGYRFAEKLGLKTVPRTPSLVPLITEEKWCAELQGLSLKNTALKIIDGTSGKKVYDDFGEMMFTHFGVTGPMILSASAHLKDIESGKYRVHLDLKPALDRKELEKRVLSDFEKYINRDLANALGDLLPSKLIPVFIRLSGIDPHKKLNEITKAERMTVCDLLKDISFTPVRFRPVSEAIVTRGGVAVWEINPKTMESKKIAGLYFAGEVIDVDAYTGGFNLQIAFCTAVCAARAAAESILYK